MTKLAKRFTLAELAAYSRSELLGDPACLISGVNTLEEASNEDASFLANPRYREMMKESQAGVVCIDRNTPPLEGKNYLVSDDPSHAFQTIVKLLISSSQSGFQGIHPTAVIHETAEIGCNVTIGPYAVIDRGVKIGNSTFIGPQVCIGFDVEIGTSCTLHPGVVVRERCRIGHRVILQPGAIIGSCGFGYLPDAQGHFHKLEQLGIV
ncbi:MAG TPA: LpxD N-terminal domain-containing protein, partial [Anaerolineales bacterium]|nr:LpxD N-terminal domain-containing protein [Anaerolineales bacterium]